MRSATSAARAVFAGILLVGWIDLVTGIEIRLFPLYFLPLVGAAWRFGVRGALVASVFASASWVLAMYLGGRHYSRDYIWVANAISMTVAFLTVSVLVAHLRTRLEREHALSRTDALTGLWNSRAFRELAQDRTALCRRNGRPVTLAYVDLDNFKRVNDTLGHAAGDALLQSVARAMRESLRSTDVPARMGGDEFVLLLPEATAEQAFMALEEMLRAGDQLMYGVKTTSKNRVIAETWSADGALRVRGPVESDSAQSADA